MIFRFFIITACVFILFLMLITGTRLLARRDPPARIAALLPDSSCEPPCWQGLRPGYIEAEAVQNWIDDPPGNWLIHYRPDLELGIGMAWQVTLPDKDSFTLIVARYNTQVPEIVLWPDKLVLGDLMAALGEPDYIDFVRGYDRQNRQVLTFQAYFQEPRLVANGAVPFNDAQLSPSATISGLVYQTPPWSRPVLAFDWLGFGRITRYYPHGVLP